MNIAIFSGSFNPIHIGHLILGNFVTEFTEIDEVWYLVTPHNPLKDSIDLLNESLRYEMAKMALRGYDKLKASDFEFNLSRPSYTIQTLDALREAYPQHRFSLLIGADNWSVFDQWKDYQSIVENYKIYVYPRLGSRISIMPKFRNRVEALDSPIVEISSTFIRENIVNGKDMRVFLPTDVYDFIIEKGLYR
ncbi:nicotinate (nicotinamide) nucleotide adenylyltransferase [Dysgonomonas sp. 520]|uniref:nicotinate (nicotinamide) nucleotide adenylyltransferase n=1 Tax=Dysgonomonas sp. 520 TaxID=2302931 RepID=UPI0013D39D14|nr:nicotinate (nicotinamide) nucleotide adenylyltransferase [Dysgonomonas sp. 520]NDW09865.1 nicotinate-nucleotide adenylyltransferase [Dysgonomonas sp. 520]